MSIITHCAGLLHMMNLTKNQYNDANLNNIYYTKTSCLHPDSIRQTNESDLDFKERIKKCL